jgi:hypothetical protein
MKPRVLMVGRTRYRLPLDASLRPKFDALGAVFDLRVIGSGTVGGDRGDATFALLPPVRPRSLDGLLFYLRLPFAVARELRRFEPDAVLAQSPYEGLGSLLGRSSSVGRLPSPSTSTATGARRRGCTGRD